MYIWEWRGFAGNGTRRRGGKQKGNLNRLPFVENIGVEPMTSCMPCKRMVFSLVFMF